MAKNSEKYWADRAARDMVDAMEDAENVAVGLMGMYIGGSRYLQGEAKKIFTTFRTRHGLSVKDAERLIIKAQSTDLKVLLTMLSRDPKNKSLIAEYEAHAYGARIARVSALMDNVDKITIAIGKEQAKRVAALLSDTVQKCYYKSIFHIQQMAGYAFRFKTLGKDVIKKILGKRWHGSDFSEKIWGNVDRLAKKVKNSVLINLLTGRDWRKAAKDIDAEMGKGYNNARRVVRTESAFAAGQATLEGYNATGVKKYIYVAILDLRTSITCRNLDGKTFETAKAKVGTNYPPMHPWCRSTTIPWVPKELLAKLKRSAINKDGKAIKVPSTMTYWEWYKLYIKDAKEAKK